MLKFFKKIFKGKKKTLNEHFDSNDEMEIVASEMDFVIRKINTIDHLTGATVLHQMYDTYQGKNSGGSQDEMMTAVNMKKLQKVYGDVLLAGIVSPKIVRKKEDAKDGAVFVENFFTDWELASELYTAIMNFTYGKKKMKEA